jgi:hypothetical protein
LAKRDAMEDPFASGRTQAPAPRESEPDDDGPETKSLSAEDADRALAAAWRLVA